MNDEEKIIICSGKGASLAIEAALIVNPAIERRKVRAKLKKAKELIDEAVADLERAVPR